MEINILDSQFAKIGVLDTFNSLIWTDRYCGYGDFEFTKAVDYNFVSLLSNGVYLSIYESDHLMIIEDIRIITDVEDGNRIFVSGRSIETILKRRIVWEPISLVGNFQEGILQILTENALDPVDPDRKISKLEFEASTDPTITSLEINSQFSGVDLYQTIFDLCMKNSLGFKITLTNLGMLKFTLYNGADRSYDQLVNPYIVFSPELDNLINSEYNYSSKLYKTVSVVYGEEGVGNVRRKYIVTTLPDGGTDLNRREIATNASDVTRTTPEGESLSDEDYDILLEQRGLEDLAQNTITEDFNGLADITRTYKYGEDFFLGDIIQVANEYGKEGKARLIELIRSQDTSGINIYPTFSF